MSEARIRTWAYTVQNLSDMDYIHVENYDVNQIDWCVVAQETGENEGRTHFQCAVRFKNGKSFSATQKFLGLKAGDELAAMRSAEFTNAAYCLKGTLSREDWESEGVDHEQYGLGCVVVRQIGTLPVRGAGKTSVWDDIIQAIKSGWSDLEIMTKWAGHAVRCQTAIAKFRLIYEQETATWRDVETIYVTGATETGKTRYVMDTYGYNNVYRVQNYDSGAFDMYDGQEVVLFEEFRSGFKIEQMLNFLDGYPCQLPARYANKMAKFTKVFINTNWRLDEQYKSIQANYPSTWEAFLRRVDGRAEVLDDSMCFTMKDGSLRVDQLPWMRQGSDSEQ